MLHVGIIGCGAIGRELSRGIDQKWIDARLVALCDINPKAAESVRRELKTKPPIVPLPRLVALSNVIVECAAARALAGIARAALKPGKTVIAMSVAGILSQPSLLQLARKRKAALIIPSGAIGGLDTVKAAALGDIKYVTLTTRKPPLALAGSPGLKKLRLNPTAITEPVLVYDGPALGAAMAFPANLNVAASLSLAGIGPKRTRVRIFADPGVTRNIHEVAVEGEFGKLISRTENLPSPTNIKTSFLAVFSALECIRSLDGSGRIGT